MTGDRALKIPITMCHGIRPQGDRPLPVEHLDRLVGIAAEMGFESIGYDELAAWRDGSDALPERPIMFGFDHPVRSMGYEVREVLGRYGYSGNLFVFTGPLDPTWTGPQPSTLDTGDLLTWDELGELRGAGWGIGTHTSSHPDLSALSVEDLSGERVRQELDRCNEAIERYLGFVPKDFAFTSTTWSSAAETEVMKRYRFGHLWIIGSEYMADGKPMRYAELVGVDGPDEADGGPPGGGPLHHTGVAPVQAAVDGAAAAGPRAVGVPSLPGGCAGGVTRARQSAP